MDNKDVVNKLVTYYLNQSDTKLLARVCANFAIDLNRFLHFDELTEEEKSHLLRRTQSNMSQIYDFIRTGCTGEIEIIDASLKD
jgi:hypothetical protein